MLGLIHYFLKTILEIVLARLYEKGQRAYERREQNKRIEELARESRIKLENAKTLEERRDAARNLADHSF